MLAAYEARSIDSDELHSRLLKAVAAAESDSDRQTLLVELADSVDEARDLGRNEREDIAWATAAYWRGTRLGP